MSRAGAGLATGILLQGFPPVVELNKTVIRFITVRAGYLCLELNSAQLECKLLTIPLYKQNLLSDFSGFMSFLTSMAKIINKVTIYSRSGFNFTRFLYPLGSKVFQQKVFLDFNFFGDSPVFLH